MDKTTKNCKNIVWICPGFAADEEDSQCIPPLQLLAKAMGERESIHLQIISLHYPQRSTPYKWHGITVLPCYVSGTLSRWRIWWKAIQQIRLLAKQKKLDGLHSFWLTDAALIAHWASRMIGCPHWVTLAGQDARSSNRYLRLLPTKKMYTIAVSPFHAEVWKQSTGQSVRQMIPWGIAPSLNPQSALKRPIDFIGVGSLIPLKSYTLFVELISVLKKEYPNIKAVLIGDGPARAQLEAKIQTLGLESNLYLIGAISRIEVLTYMEHSKVLFHPSTYESFGFVLVEAMACGLHLVSRPVGIAQAEEGWWVGTTSAELLQGMREALETFEQAKPRFPYLLSDTFAAYLRLYQDELFSINS